MLTVRDLPGGLRDNLYTNEYRKGRGYCTTAAVIISIQRLDETWNCTAYYAYLSVHRLGSWTLKIKRMEQKKSPRDETEGKIR